MMMLILIAITIITIITIIAIIVIITNNYITNIIDDSNKILLVLSAINNWCSTIYFLHLFIHYFLQTGERIV